MNNFAFSLILAMNIWDLSEFAPNSGSHSLKRNARELQPQTRENLQIPMTRSNKSVESESYLVNYGIL